MSNEVPIEIFVDDLGAIMLGQPISKLTFVSMQQNGDPNDAPRQAARVVITMTTQALINACNVILKNVHENRDGLVVSAENNLTTLKSSLPLESPLQKEKLPSVEKAKSRP